MLLWALFMLVGANAFVTPPTNFLQQAPIRSSSPNRLFESKNENEVDISTRFNALLRDLQIENVPILGCDADNVFSVSAALWTTLSEMAESDEGEKICLLMENIPMDAVKAFVMELEVLKKQDHIMEQLPELKRVSANIMGKDDVFPAVILETATRTPDEKKDTLERQSKVEECSENKSKRALQRFVQRMFVDLGTNPIEGTQSLRFSKTVDMVTTLAIFWTCVCELNPESSSPLGSILLSLPCVAPSSRHDRFAAATEVLSHQLSLFECQSIFDVTYCHPCYERKVIEPSDATAYGHIPPPSYLRPILRSSDFKDEAERLSWDELNLLNYERRSPHTIIRMDRVTKRGESVELDIGEGKIATVPGVDKYAKNMVTLANAGEVELKNALNEEINLMVPSKGFSQSSK